MRLNLPTCLLAAAVVAGGSGLPGIASETPAGAGDAGSFDELLADIDRRSAQISDLTATFEQQKFTALLRKPLTSTGVVRVKGAVSRWDTKKPEPAVLHADRREIRMYYPRQKVVEVYPIDRRLSELAASPLPRLAALRQHFTIERHAGPAGGATANQLPLRLLPKDDFLKEHVDEVRVVLDVATACVVSVEVLDADGDRTLIRFDGVKLNTGLKEADLSLEMPVGTRVSRPLDGSAGGGEGGSAR